MFLDLTWSAVNFTVRVSFKSTLFTEILCDKPYKPAVSLPKYCFELVKQMANSFFSILSSNRLRLFLIAHVTHYWRVSILTLSHQSAVQAQQLNFCLSCRGPMPSRNLWIRLRGRTRESMQSSEATTVTYERCLVQPPRSADPAGSTHKRGSAVGSTYIRAWT